MTSHEASALIGVSPATLRRWSDAGDIEAFTTPGGHRRFSRTAMAGFLPAPRRERPDPAVPERIARAQRREIIRAALAAPWLSQLEPSGRAAVRDQARRLAAGLLRSFEAPTAAERGSARASAEAVAAEYGRIARLHGIPIRETVEVVLRSRAPFVRELAEAARRRELAPPESTELLEAAAVAIDRLVSAVMCGHEAAAAEVLPDPS
jgi:excisionase family DNA binding protein